MRDRERKKKKETVLGAFLAGQAKRGRGIQSGGVDRPGHLGKGLSSFQSSSQQKSEDKTSPRFWVERNASDF